MVRTQSRRYGLDGHIAILIQEGDDEVEDGRILLREVDGLGFPLLELPAQSLAEEIGLQENVLVDLRDFCVSDRVKVERCGVCKMNVVDLRRMSACWDPHQP